VVQVESVTVPSRPHVNPLNVVADHLAGLFGIGLFNGLPQP
jgi:hypothetical protein